MCADVFRRAQRCLMRYVMRSGKGIAVLSRAMRRDRERRKNRCQKQRYVWLRASSASSQAFNSAQCLVCLTIIAKIGFVLEFAIGMGSDADNLLGSLALFLVPLS